MAILSAAVNKDKEVVKIRDQEAVNKLTDRVQRAPTINSRRKSRLA